MIQKPTTFSVTERRAEDFLGIHRRVALRVARERCRQHWGHRIDPSTMKPWAKSPMGEIWLSNSGIRSIYSIDCMNCDFFLEVHVLTDSYVNWKDADEPTSDPDGRSAVWTRRWSAVWTRRFGKWLIMVDRCWPMRPRKQDSLMDTDERARRAATVDFNICPRLCSLK